jgi:hypothetical protein
LDSTGAVIGPIETGAIPVMSHVRSIQAAFACAILPHAAIAQTEPASPEKAPEASPAAPGAPELSFKQRLINLLPEPVSDGLEFDLWAWYGSLWNNEKSGNQYFDAELSFAVTKSFGEKATVGVQINLIDANNTGRVQVEQSYLSLKLWDDAFVTFGKFNANFGFEGRDFWDRTTGTTSLLFNAQPQDLVGIMLTQPLGDSGITMRPFVSVDFQGEWNFDQPPSGGVNFAWRPVDKLHLSMTHWVGPGFVLYGGEPIHHPYEHAYGGDSGTAALNWQGPNLSAERKGTLYFFETTAVWEVLSDLTLSAEFLVGTTNTQGKSQDWWGVAAQADYNLTRNLHAFGRYSYIDDHRWLITGFFQRRQEFSAGAGYRFLGHFEVRAEYRHDWSDSQEDVDSVSVHITLTW